MSRPITTNIKLFGRAAICQHRFHKRVMRDCPRDSIIFEPKPNRDGSGAECNKIDTILYVRIHLTIRG